MNIIETLQKEIDRVEKIIFIYEKEAGIAGQFAVNMMKFSISIANKMIATGDTVGMIKALEELRTFEV